MYSLSSLGSMLILLVLMASVRCSSPGPTATTANLNAPEAPAPQRTIAQVSTGEYLITLKDNADPSVLRKLCLQAKEKHARALGKQRFLLQIRPDPGLEALTRAAYKSGQVAEVQPNFRYEALPSLKLKPR